MTDGFFAFPDLRLKAASDFAQTMIVIDDEASQENQLSDSHPTGTLRRPDRRTRLASKHASTTETGEARVVGKHELDAKSLIDKAMDLGLICSVLRPKKGENFQARVVNTAQVADIICLDWEIYDDGGDAASSIISNIIQKDARQHGRLRLIAIYTGDTTNNKILEKIFDAIPKRIRDNHEFRRRSLEIESSNGVKIVCLFKTHGVQLPEPRNVNQVSESELPERLLAEFATLSEGLLSNVALVTIGAIRRSTHHVLAKFVGQMDGPYFHHRTRIKSPEDAEEYAVEIILSELKGAVDKLGVAATYAGPGAIAAGIRELAGDQQSLTLQHGSEANPGVFELGTDVLIRMVKDGLAPVLGEGQIQNAPKKKVFEENFSTFFCANQEAARSYMNQFASLTGIRAYPGVPFYKSGQIVARLGLGSVIQDGGKNYLLCLQASCDSVRIKGNKSFLFVPMEIDNATPEHVVPVSSSANSFKYMGLRTSSESYRVVRSIYFSGSPDTQTVNAKKIGRRTGFYFEDTKGQTYRWIADLKRRRALRVAQRIGRHLGRLGFDEFEPYRRGDE